MRPGSGSRSTASTRSTVPVRCAGSCRPPSATSLQRGCCLGRSATVTRSSSTSPATGPASWSVPSRPRPPDGVTVRRPVSSYRGTGRKDVLTMAHVPLIDQPKGLLRRFAWRYSRKEFGKVVDPVRAAAHHSGVLMASGALETTVAKSWKALDPQLRWLALQATSAAIGCSWCIDYGYFDGMQSGVDPRKVRDVPRWRDSDVYDERERVLLEYAEAVNATPS